MELKNYRKQKKMSQGRLAELTGISQTQISLYETGKIEMSEENELLIQNTLEGKVEENIDSIIHNEPFTEDEQNAIAQFSAYCMGRLGVERAAKMITNMSRAQLRSMAAVTGFLET